MKNSPYEKELGKDIPFQILWLIFYEFLTGVALDEGIYRLRKPRNRIYILAYAVIAFTLWYSLVVASYNFQLLCFMCPVFIDDSTIIVHKN